MDAKAADEYNAVAEVLREELRTTHAVAKLILAEREGARISLCAWPEFGPFVMPPCDVVDVIRLRRLEGKIVGAASTGYISQHLLFAMLGALVREVHLPVRHFVCDVTAPAVVQDRIAVALVADPDLAMSARET